VYNSLFQKSEPATSFVTIGSLFFVMVLSLIFSHLLCSLFLLSTHLLKITKEWIQNTREYI
jgi:hypothetical protein